MYLVLDTFSVNLLHWNQVLAFCNSTLALLNNEVKFIKDKQMKPQIHPY